MPSASRFLAISRVDLSGDLVSSKPPGNRSLKTRLIPDGLELQHVSSNPPIDHPKPHVQLQAVNTDLWNMPRE